MKSALLVIDVLNDFLDPQGALFCGPPARTIIAVIGSLLDHFHREGLPVFYLCDAHAPDDAEFALFPPHAVNGTWGAAIIPELEPQSGDRVLAKTRFSSFYGTSLDAELAREAPAEVWVSGVCTSICVMDTVGDLRNRGYTPLVVVDAVADFDPQFHQLHWCVWSGVCTSICVMDTVGDLRNRGYTPLVVVDAVADFDPQFHQFALVRMERVYGAKQRIWHQRPVPEPAPI